MKERPILFNSEMVRAVLEGRKTQTRRVIKPQPEKVGWNEGIFYKGDYWTALTGKCPYGKVGDRLWVKEDIRVNDYFDCFYEADSGSVDPKTEDGTWTGIKVPYDDEYVGIIEAKHIPRKLSRITLEVVSVRVERVQEITHQDIKAEGIFFDDTYWRSVIHPVKGSLKCWPTAHVAFEQLWNSINDKRGFGWDKNPWVWVVEFKVIKGDS